MAHKSKLIEQDIEEFLKQHEHKGLVRAITCGSVDDGKSTLIGRLLYDAGMLFEDQLAAIASAKRLSGGELDFSLALDGLQAEREQGITIDVAYRYFSTEKKKFIVADCPGHEQYTRNMVTGASTAQLAIILIDAVRGVKVQTRRHALICSLLGVKQFIIAVNKMDLIAHSQEVFKKIETEIISLCQEIGVSSVIIIPVSAVKGDNVASRSSHMHWYSGPTLLEALEEIQETPVNEKAELRMPIQYVNRGENFRGYCGSVVEGNLKCNQVLKILPSGKFATIQSILKWQGPIEEAVAGEAICVTFTDNLDVSRGDMLVSAQSSAELTDRIEADVIWMSEKELLPGKKFLFQFGPREVTGIIASIKHQLDVNTGKILNSEHLTQNGVAYCGIELSTKIIADTYLDHPRTGRFIIIDLHDNSTAGAGLIRQSLPPTRGGYPQSKVTWQEFSIHKDMRAKLKLQTPLCIWFTGLSASGKTTLANALEQKLHELGRHTMLLDGDNIRHGLSRDLGMSAEDRTENIRRVGEVSKLMTEAGLIVITSFISPSRVDREEVKKLFAPNQFMEIYVSTPIEVCRQRDQKGLYQKADTGEIADFTGVSSPYEGPTHPDLKLDTGKYSVEECLAKIMEALKDYVI